VGDLLNRARELAPALRRRARATEQLRRILDETVSDFAAAGFYRIFQPRRYGGYEMDYGTQLELAAELGRGCASSAWDASITACHSWILGMFPPEAQEDVWGGNRHALVSTSFLGVDPRTHPAKDGFRASGRWKFSSGVQHCDWVILMILVPPRGGEGPPERAFGLVPLAECRVEDTWHVAGLAGTGSNDVVVDDAHIPAHRVLRVADTRGGPTPGSAVNDGYLYRLPLFTVFPYNIVGPGIGAARGALETVVESVAGRTSQTTRAKVAEQQSAHLRLSRAAAEVDAAYALIRRNCDEFNAVVKAGGLPTTDQRVRYRRDTSYAAATCARAIDRVLPLMGGQGLSLDSPVQRAWRDAHAVAQHIGLVWDVHGAAYGSVAMGFPPADPNH
jgi:3-hydroxy-9,10-secoandrosta-1,3,5(10)-triene-9,17-dione monooxygenase